ncbi:Methyl-accepting chemotaxis protein signailling domain-containing protein, double cache domain-containing protein [Desulfonema limicola]|uniref:Methyl-accepting chemotaxis protein signailling domain-containing protein, double cache domain-containing protein n=1 Tax=Desulfonema limicola TaxID=45656 RepID=A0A975B513_9BACT|nr:cache domain-containing protein [Desulfonema limicola]QTA78920.1 Methyl-accepting chemotaxis protein signailling domain-containing protein, double cache domain-containing protein [Desulfonema limicola]
MNISTKIILLITLSLLLTSGIISLLAVFQIRQTGRIAIEHVEILNSENIKKMEAEQIHQEKIFSQELNTRKNEYLKSQVQTAMSVLKKSYMDAADPEKLKNIFMQQLQNSVDTAYGLLESLAKDEELSLEEQQAKAIEIIKSIRYGSEHKDYFWINDMRPYMIMHPYKPELDGKGLSDYKDPNGKYLFVEFVKVCKEKGQGFVDYYWPKYDGDNPQPKLSFVRLFKPWNWIIGSGIYMEIAEDIIKSKAAESIKNLRYGPEHQDYFWINDMRPYMVMHPYKPELDGKDLADYKDPNGKRLFVEFVKTCSENGEGFVDYYWPKYGADKPQPKRSFVTLFKPWNWVIGTGLYIDDIQEIFDKRHQMLKEDTARAVEDMKQRIETIKTDMRIKINKVLLKILILTTLIIVFALYLTYIFTRKNITTPIMRVIRGLKESAQQIAAAASEIAEGSQVVAESVCTQAASVQESSSSLEQMSAMSRHTTDLTKGAEELMNLNIEKSGRSLKALMDLTIDISKIESDSDSISKIINEIDAIAFQTNLLSLNAAVEAARAGAAGTGFAVVAGEVKSLAMRTTEAADNTQDLLNQTLARVNHAAASIKGVNNDFADIIESATIMGERTQSITQASGEQARGIEQLSIAANEIDKVTQQIAANSQESAAAAEELSAQAEDMTDFVKELAAVVGFKDKK